MNKNNNKNLTNKSQSLRNNMTKEERHLWYAFLRLLPFTINRQKVIGNYIVDFYCAEKKIIIELDGSQHYEKESFEYDKRRTAFLESCGFKVLRYSNLDVKNNFYAVCTDISKKLGTPHPSPTEPPSPQGEGMKVIMNSEKGDVTFIVLVSTALILIFIIFSAMVVFLNNVNLIVHNLKNDLFLIARNTLFAIDRDMLGENIESFYEVDFKRLIEKGIKESWKLDDNLKGEGIVKEAKIIEVRLLKKGENDEIKNRFVKVPTVHIIVSVKIKPIIFSSVFKDRFIFNLHEDIRIKKYN